MVNISKALNAGEAQQYHEKDYSHQEQAYYSKRQEINGQWQGRLAQEMNLTGDVTAQQFERMTEGFHPETGQQLVQQKTFRDGADSKTAEHRAGWDATFSAPKSVSLTAIVGEDTRVREAHREAVTVALNEMERYVNARMGGNIPTQNTGKWAVAKFEHDSARPVSGYAAPQLHTHAFFFNVTETADGKTRALDPQALYGAQTVGTSVYQAELTHRLTRMGYEFAQGKSGAPEIKGYSPEYLQVQSARSQQIKEYMEKHGLDGKEAANIAAKTTRENKTALDVDRQRETNSAVAAQFGNQERAVMAAARENARHLPSRSAADELTVARQAVTFSTRKVFERESQVTEGMLIREALNRSVGQVRFADLRSEIDRRIHSRELLSVESNRAGHVPRYASSELVSLERATLQMLRQGQGQQTPIVPVKEVSAFTDRFPQLNQNQRAAIEQTLAARDSITAIQGSAGTGKTTSLSALRGIAEECGYTVQGFAPTSRAAHQLAEAGIAHSTLQKHLARGEQAHDNQINDRQSNAEQPKRLYVLDESSLASTRQVHEFLARLHQGDRVVMVGDIRQHQAVDAGTPFQTLQAGGMQTAVLDKIVRQTSDDLKATVEHLVLGKADVAFANLERAGAIHEIRNARDRQQQLAESYVHRTGTTLVVAPDNQSRRDLNALIHQEMQKTGRVSPEEHAVSIRIARQDLTGADREWAAKYEVGDEIRYGKGSAKMGLKNGEFATVKSVDSTANQLTVERADGSQSTYDPQRLKGVTVYRTEERTFSTGDRIQFTAPQKELAVVREEGGRATRITHGVANRETATITAIDAAQNEIRLRLDRGGSVSLSLSAKQHIDLGYAVTSHSSQGSTSDAVLVYVDNARTNPALINDRLFYVAISRARESAEIYTDNSAALKEALSRDVSKSSALSGRQIKAENVIPQHNSTESHRALTAFLRGYAERLALPAVFQAHVDGMAQTTAAFATATLASEYALAPQGEPRKIAQLEPDQPKQEQRADPAQDRSYPDMEISF